MTYPDELAEMPDALEDSEIARLMKLVSDSGYKKSEDAPTLKKQAFMPRSLVEIAMESQKNREGKENPTNVETDLEESMKQKVDENDQGIETNRDNAYANSDSPNSEIVTSETQDTAPSDLAPSSQLDQDIISIENSEPPKTSDKQQDSTDSLTDGEVFQASTLSKNNQENENAHSENIQNEESGFVQHTATETNHSTNVENDSIRYDEGFNAGLEAGRKEIKESLEQNFSEQQNTFDTLITTLTKMNSAETKELEANIQAAILSLASERAGIAISEMPENFITRIEQLMNRLGSSVDSPVIKLNTADLKHIETAKENSETLSNIRFIEDEMLNHGDISISLGGIEIEDILENRTFISPFNADLETDVEQPYSEIDANISVTPQDVDKNTLENNISDEIVGNNPDQQEGYKISNQEFADKKQNIGDENTDIDTSDGVE